MLVYALPIGEERYSLWTPSPRFVWGELENVESIIVMTGFANVIDQIDMDSLKHTIHDNLYRPTTLRALHKKQVGGRRSFGYLMIWGAIWLIGMDRPLEDVISGIYLLAGMPLLAKMSAAIFSGHQRAVAARFKGLAHFPEVDLVYSDRLAILEEYLDAGGFTVALQCLDELGLNFLREFYKRGAWSERWTITPPTGLGTVPFTKEVEKDMRHRRAWNQGEAEGWL